MSINSKPQGQQAAHSPGPWIAADVGEIRGRIFEIQQASIGGGREIQINGANARRIVACVNACEGIPDSILSAGAGSVVPGITLKSVMAGADALRADNARLREALTLLVCTIGAKGGPTTAEKNDAMTKARAVLFRKPEAADAALKAQP